MQTRPLFVAAVVTLAVAVTACGPQPADDSPSANATSGLRSLPAGAELRTTEVVNVRTRPDASAPVATVLGEGTVVVTATGGVDGGWVQISINGTEGWVFASYVSPTACLELVHAATELASSVAQCSGLQGITIRGSDRYACEAAAGACSVAELQELLSVARCQVEASVCRNPQDTARLVQELYDCAEDIDVSPACLNAG